VALAGQARIARRMLGARGIAPADWAQDPRAAGLCDLARAQLAVLLSTGEPGWHLPHNACAALTARILCADQYHSYRMLGFSPAQVQEIR
jgi:hypothetical protein